jgi:hypothetical protein
MVLAELLHILKALHDVSAFPARPDVCGEIPRRMPTNAG